MRRSRLRSWFASATCEGRMGCAWPWNRLSERAHVGGLRRLRGGVRMRRVLIVASMAALVSRANITAAEPVAYPTKGQSADQQNRDEYECHEWAQKETGVDPVAVAEQAAGTSKSD